MLRPKFSEAHLAWAPSRMPGPGRDDRPRSHQREHSDKMGKPKELKDKMFSAAVIKMSFRLRGDEASPAFLAVFPGVLRDLHLDDADVERYIEENREIVEKAARGHSPAPG